MLITHLDGRYKAMQQGLRNWEKRLGEKEAEVEQRGKAIEDKEVFMLAEGQKVRVVVEGLRMAASMHVILTTYI